MKRRNPTFWLRLVLSLLAGVLVPAAAAAQAGFRQHEAGFGIVISLPASWRADSGAELSALRERSLEGMRVSPLDQLRELAAHNENALLFRARDNKERANSANMNVTVSPEITRSSFPPARTAEVGSIVAMICSGFIAQARDAGGTARCLRHEVVTIENRKALVILQEASIPRAGLDNRHTVVLLPSDGLLFTLSISLIRSAADPALSRTIIASLRLPAGI